MDPEEFDPDINLDPAADEAPQDELEDPQGGEPNPDEDPAPSPAPAGPSDDDLDRQAYERLSQRYGPGVFARQQQQQPAPQGDDEEEISYDPQQIVGSAVQRSTNTYREMRKAETQLEDLLTNQPTEVKKAARDAFFNMDPRYFAVPNAIKTIVAHAVGDQVLAGNYTPAAKPKAAPLPKGAPVSNAPARLADPALQKQLDAYNRRVPADMRLTAKEFKEAMR